MMPNAAKPERGMVTSPHALATQRGVEVLASGGNAVEAAIATAACLCVTYPHFCGFAGDAFLLICGPGGKMQTISGIGQAASNTQGYKDAIPVRGPRSALTSAATVDALGKAFEISQSQLGGCKSWGELLAPAIELARNGFPLTESQRFWLNFRLSERESLADVYRAHGVDGQAPQAGRVLKQAALATTIEMLAERGPRDFYEGKLARRIARGLADAGSPLTLLDLSRTQARIEPALSVAYRGGALFAHQPPTQGVTTLEIMGILERFNLKGIAEGSADYYHLLVEAVKQAFMDRNRYIADPDFGEVPAQMLLSARHLDCKADAIRMDKALPWPHTYKPGDTVYIGATDEAGHCVSMLATIYYDWGSGVMAGDTGLLWHNRGAAFSMDPRHPNCLAPGKRPFHTLNPGIYVKNDKVKFLYGTQGADGQPQTLAALLTRLIDYGFDPLQALARPRFLLGKTFSDSNDSLKLEDDVAAQTLAELSRRGHQISTISSQNPLMGHPGAIVIDPVTSVISGAHDPRSDGLAIGLCGATRGQGAW